MQLFLFMLIHLFLLANIFHIVSSVDTTIPYSVTLVSQCTSDRVWMLEDICQRWPGPISIAVFVPYESKKINTLSCNNNDRLNYYIYEAKNEKELIEYPVNKLRNIAINLVKTSHFLIADIDFWPSNNLYNEILKHSLWHLKNPLYGMIIPAFQRDSDGCRTIETCHFQSKRNNFIPNDLNSLKQCIFNDKKCIVFQSDNSLDSHSSTNTADWLKYSTKWLIPKELKCFKSSRYEPYIVLPKNSVPKYDERFVGYGKNKIEYIHHLRYRGFKFAILPKEFLIHFPHPKSTSKLSWLSNSTKHKSVDKQFKLFIGELSRTHKPPTTKICGWN
mmetsp:Transcript_25589/g.33312  ORF Transcript_25589/g.33312 Transcript_25589/m.33312 type:complete len:331 (+) Transcript_25589:110-1102(+)